MMVISPAAYKVCGWRLERTNRARWLELRREGIGGSDAAAAVLGTDGRRSRWRLYLDKTGQGPAEELTEAQAEWIEWGHAMEPVIAKMWARRQNIPGRLLRAGMLARRDRPWQRVNVDRIVTDCGLGLGPCLLECKNRSAWQAAQWGPVDSDQIPDAPAIQVQHALAVTGYSHGHLLAGIGGNELRWYKIDADPALQAVITEEESWFWHDCVLARVPPPIDASEATGKILARLWDAEPGKVTPATDGQAAMVGRLREARQRAGEAAAEQARLENEVKQEMGDAEVLLDPGTGRPLVTWIPNGTFRDKAFRAERPELAAKYETVRHVTATGALAEDQPEVYRAYRSRQFTVKAPPREKP
jgi:putative phage-type endonuclease